MSKLPIPVLRRTATNSPYMVLINEPDSLRSSVFPLLVCMAISLPIQFALIASPLPMLLTREPFSLRISTFPFKVVITTKDWSALKLAQTASPLPIVLTKLPLSFLISTLPLLILMIFILIRLNFAYSVLDFRQSPLHYCTTL